MTPERLIEVRALLGWTRYECARQLNTNEREIRRWEAGSKIPDASAEWLEKVARFLERNPAPPKVDRRKKVVGNHG